jgi:hypothetical protein
VIKNRTELDLLQQSHVLFLRRSGATVVVLLAFCAGLWAQDRGGDEEVEIPRRGILRLELTVGGRTTRVSTPKAALGKLQAAAKRVGQGDEFSATLNINGTVRQFDDPQQFAVTCSALERILSALKQERIPLGDLGTIETTSASDQQQPSSLPVGRRGRDGDDGLGQGGGLGGQSGGAVGYSRPLNPSSSRSANGDAQGNQQVALFKHALAQLLQRGQPLRDEDQNQNENDIQNEAQNEDAVEAEEKEPEGKEDFEGPGFSGEAKLLGRATHGSYDKATFSFEFGIRDDPTVSIGNDWDLQFGSVPLHFHVTMVSDDRSRIVDLGSKKMDEIAVADLEELPANPFPRREFVRAIEGHVYLVHTVDRNTDLYALFRVNKLNADDSCEISWKRVSIGRIDRAE